MDPSEDTPRFPAHRIVGRALVVTVVAAPLLLLVLGAQLQYMGGYMPTFIPQLPAPVALFCLLLALCSGVALNVRSRWRPFLLLALAPVAVLVLELATVWLLALDEGPQEAFLRVQKHLSWLLDGTIDEEWIALRASLAIAIVTLALVPARALSLRLSRYADRLWLHLLGGGLGALLITAIQPFAWTSMSWSDPDAVLVYLYGAGALTCSVGTFLGDRLDGVVVRILRARREGAG